MPLWMKERAMLLSLMLLAGLSLSACGGSDSDSDSGSTPTTTPRSIGQAVAQQKSAAATVQQLIEELIAGENAANQALDEERYADFDAYWQNDYPNWVDRFDQAAQEFARAEDFVRNLALSDPAASSTKAVPLPIVLLAASTITTIAAAEKERRNRLNDDVEGNEREALIEARTRALQRQGLGEQQARTRAIVDVTQLLVLQGLKNGIEHARTFVVEQLPNFFGEYLPQAVSGGLDLIDASGKIEQIRDSATVLFSDKDCNSQQKIEEFPACRLVFCDPADLQCDEVPPGDWSLSVIDSGFVRDEVDTTVTAGSTGSASVTLFTPEEAQAALEPPNSGDPSFIPIETVDFQLDLRASGTRFGPQTPVGGVAEERALSISATGVASQSPFSCFFFSGTPAEIGYAFQQQLAQGSGSNATNVLSFVGGLIRTNDCALLPLISLVQESTLQSDDDVELYDLDIQLVEVPQLSLSGGSTFENATEIRYGLSGSAVCAAIEEFDYDADDGDYFAQSAVCDSSSRLEVIFRR